MNSTYLHLKLLLRSAVLMSAAGASFLSHSGESWVKHPFLKVPGYQYAVPVAVIADEIA